MRCGKALKAEATNESTASASLPDPWLFPFTVAPKLIPCVYSCAASLFSIPFHSRKVIYFSMTPLNSSHSLQQLESKRQPGHCGAGTDFYPPPQPPTKPQGGNSVLSPPPPYVP